MKIQILSDLHLEFFNSNRDLNAFLDNIIPVDVPDVLVIAGDLGLHSGSFVSLGTIINALVCFGKYYRKVFYVLGNHEYYHSSFKETNEMFSRIETSSNCLIGEDRIKILMRERIVFKDQGFVGCTLWFNERPENFLRKNLINDFKFISDSLDVFHKEADKDIKFIGSNVRPGDIIITHHLPSYQSIRKFSDMSDIYFVHDHAENMLSKNVSVPSLWVHGHTHESKDYMLGDTRIVCNPVGYLNKNENLLFNPNMIVEV